MTHAVDLVQNIRTQTDLVGYEALFNLSDPTKALGGCGYSNVTWCVGGKCDVGIDGLYPASDYEYECWSLAVPNIRKTGSFRTQTPTLGCGPFSCMAINSLAGLMTVWNATATAIFDTANPVRYAATNGKTHCGLHAAEVRIDLLLESGHVLECVGTQKKLFETKTGTGLYDVSLGEFHQCGIARKEKISLECQGQNSWGQLGEFGSGASEGGASIAAAKPSEFKQVACSWTHCCALEFDGKLRCWGYIPSEIAQPPAGTTMLQVAAGRGYSCGILQHDSSVVCWGTNEFGQSEPPMGLKLRRVGCGLHHSCGIDLNRKVVCWGKSDMRQLVLPANIQRDLFVNIALGFLHACALSLSGFVKCWGPTLETEFSVETYSEALANSDPAFTKYGLDEGLDLQRMNGNGGYGNISANGDESANVSTQWMFYTPLEVGALDYRDMNFLPMTTKYVGGTEQGSICLYLSESFQMICQKRIIFAMTSTLFCNLYTQS